MNWNEYVARRRIDSQRWLQSKGISNEEQFREELARIDIDLPDVEQLTIMFPAEMKDGSIVLTPERVDQTSARSLASEGNGPSVRPDGKRSSKVSV